MRASLTGQNFKITPEEQVDKIFVDESIQWTWQVEPKDTGEHLLILEIFALVNDDGTDRFLEVDAKRHEIRISVASWDQRLQDFGSNNWQWLWAFIIVPFGALVLRRRRKA